MNWVVQHLWLIPGLPLLAAGAIAVTSRPHKKFAASAAIGSLALACVLSCVALGLLLHIPDPAARRLFWNFAWFESGADWVTLGWVLDPLSALMLVMVSFVGLLIFIYSVSYMEHDPNFTRFFCFLSLFAAAMLGLVLSNSLLLLFICWELVGLTSYLLIGFWYQKPSAAAAAKKAFITTRLGDVALLLGMVWLYSETGTLAFYYPGGEGCLEPGALAKVAAQTTTLGWSTATAITLLIFFGACGKSGQVPLHVWLPDAMEGPTPVSALIHAATMVAAGVFLMARIYPLAAADAVFPGSFSAGLAVVTWIGALTALLAAGIAVAQNDIKRILAYSTVSQLGYMMMGLGVGGVAVAMFHLLTHAFFKALLFLGAGSVIHGCHEEQDIRRMGGLRQFMPVTFATYAVGMLALSGFPLLFSGFWSKDEILHAAHAWQPSHGPFYLGLAGALLTAFYMTRQVCYVFFGKSRLGNLAGAAAPAPAAHLPNSGHAVHESPAVMTVPLVILAAFAVVLGIFGTPAWPWLQSFIALEQAAFDFQKLRAVASLMLLSSIVVLSGMGLGYWLYGRTAKASVPVPAENQGEQPGADPLEAGALGRVAADIFWLLQRRFFFDEVYAWSIVRWTRAWGRACDWLDQWIWDGMVQACAFTVLGFSWLARFFEEYVVNRGFDRGCQGVASSGSALSRVQSGRIQAYLRFIGVTLVILVLLVVLGGCAT